MGNWPTPDFSAPAESGSFDSDTVEIPPVSQQSAPTYDEADVQSADSAYPASSSPEVPGGQTPPAYPQDATGTVPPVYPQDNTGSVPPVYPQNQTGGAPAGYPQNGNGGVPPVYPNQSYYPQPGYPQGPGPQKKSNKLVLGIVLGVAALIIALIVILVVILFNNQKNGADSSSGDISSIVSSEVSGDSSALSGDTQTVTIGNASFAVPAEWEVDIDDDGTIFLYPSDEEVMVIYSALPEKPRLIRITTLWKAMPPTMMITKAST